jgi:hypothetical protein
MDFDKDVDEQAAASEWDAAVAENLIGKYVIAGIVYVASDGVTVEKRVQVHGIIVEASHENGFTLELKGERAGEKMTLPADTRAFFKADPGRYRLKDSNERVQNPDYTSLWTIIKRVLH